MNSKHLDLIRSNNQRSISKTITQIESGFSLPNSFYDEIFQLSNNSIRIGITGPPGAGKSTLTDQLIKEYLKLNKSVGVVAVDPSSPFTGGALLGDRIRMNNYLWNDNVFIRSMGTRGELGGLSKKTKDIGDILAASGKDIIIYETVGVGQGEHDIVKEADVTIVVLVPESGDEIQLMKAGIIEIGDIFVINKSDRDGSNKLAQSLINILHTFTKKDKHQPEVFLTSADRNKGISELFCGINNTIDKFFNDGMINKKRNKRFKKRVYSIVEERLLNKFWTNEKMDILNHSIENLEVFSKSPQEIAKSLLKQK